MSVELEGHFESLRASYLDRGGRLVAALLVNRRQEIAGLRRELASSASRRAAA